MRRILRSAAGLAGVLSLLLASAVPAQAEDKIVLGAPISRTGPFALNGTFMLDGYRFAIDAINQKGGVAVGGRRYELVLEYRDDGSKAENASAIAEALIREQQVRFLLGPYSSHLTQAVEPIAERYRVPLVQANGAGSSLSERGYRYTFAVLSNSREYFTQLFDLAERKAAPKLDKQPSEMTVAIAVQADRFSQDVRDDALEHVKQHGMRLVLDDQVSRSDNDFRMTLTRLEVLKPDIVIVSGHEEGAVSALTQIRAAGLHIPVLSLSHCDSARIIEKVGSASEGIFCPLQWQPTLSYRDDWLGSAAEFATAFAARYGYTPTYQAAQSAAAIEVYVAAIEQCQSLEPQAVRDQIAKLDIETFYGPVRFDSSGRNVAKTMFLSQVAQGKHVIVAPQAYAAREPIIEPHGD